MRVIAIRISVRILITKCASDCIQAKCAAPKKAPQVRCGEETSKGAEPSCLRQWDAEANRGRLTARCPICGKVNGVDVGVLPGPLLALRCLHLPCRHKGPSAPSPDKSVLVAFHPRPAGYLDSPLQVIYCCVLCTVNTRFVHPTHVRTTAQRCFGFAR